MPFQNSEPSLYGITSENSNRRGSSLWGKNQFNSTFPLSLCLYMRDSGVRPASVIACSGNIRTEDSGWPMEDVIGSGSSGGYFHFEKTFAEYAKFLRNADDAEKIDLVVSFNGIDKIPLELKLTVVPDSGTATEKEQNWGPEIVLRPVSSAHAMMRLAAILSESKFQKSDAQSLSNLDRHTTQSRTGRTQPRFRQTRLA